MSTWRARTWRSLGAQVEDTLPEALSETLRQHWEDLPQGSLRSERRLLWRVGELPSVVAQAQRQTLRLIEQQTEVWVRGDEFWVPGTLHVQLGRVATLTLTPQAAHSPPQALEACLLAMTEAHRAGGWLPLHAATVSVGGRAAALSGVSGAGKSTATLRLLAAGYSVLAEDRTFYSAGQVAGMDRSLRAFDDSARRFAPAWLPRSAGRDAKGKLLLPLPACASPARLERVLLFGPEQSSLSLPERVRAIWEMTGVPLTYSARQAAQRGVSELLPLLDPRPVTREDVLERVTACLEN